MQTAIVVGAGIVGLSTAYWLRKAGQDVTVIERGGVPNPLASSADHHRLIRYPYGDAEGYAARVGEAFAAWREIWADLPRAEPAYFANTGLLAVSQQAGDYTDRSRIAMERLGIPFERIDGAAGMAERLPFLDPRNAAYAILSEGGALLANRILTDLADWLRHAGGKLLEHSPVVEVDTAAGAVTLGDGRVLGGDTVIVTAGIETAGLVPALPVELKTRRTVIVYAEPPEDLAELYDGAPCWTDLGGEEDLWGMSSVEGLPMKLGNGRLGRLDPTGADRTMSAAEVASVLASYRGKFRGIDRFTVRFHQANHWTLAPEERFVLSRIGRVVVVSACSGHGFKFGALSGRDAAEAVLDPDRLDTVARRMAGLG